VDFKSEVIRVLRPHVYITRNLPSPGIELLESVCDVEMNPEDTPPKRETLVAKTRAADGILCLLTDRIDADLLASASTLKVVSSMSVGYDHIDVEAATRRGIYVTYTPGVLTDATADFAWTLLMAVARRVVEADNYLRAGEWKIQWSPTQFLGAGLAGKTLGIVGFGRIGQAVAQRAKGFKMRILYFSRTRAHLRKEKELKMEFVSFQNLLKESDFVTIHVPLSKETRHLIGENQLKQMKRSAYLINTSRGAVVDQLALARALREGWIAGAGLDVFEKEPIDPNDPLIDLTNVVLAPHIGSATVEARSKMAEVASENLLSILRGEPPEFLVNQEVMKLRPLSAVRMIT
jgi:glyoxylate reductase